MKIYHFILLDHKDQEVIKSKQRFGSAKHAAFIAQKMVDNIPPCAGKKIRYTHVSPHEVARLLNQLLK